MELVKATPQQIVEDSPLWSEGHITAVRKERRGQRVIIVFILKNGQQLELKGSDLATYNKAMPLIFEATGFPLKEMTRKDWGVFVRAVYEFAGDEVVTSSDTDDLTDLLRQWLGSQHSRTDKDLKMAENLTMLTRVMRDGKLDAYHDGKVLIFRLMPFVSYATKERQGFSRHDITGNLDRMGFRHKRIEGFRFWTGSWLSYD